MQARKALADELPLKTVLREHKRAVIISMLLTWLLSAAIVVVILMTPTYLQKQFGMDAATTLKAKDPLDDTKLRDDLEKILAKYHEKGFLDATARY